jgi:hypothetical protein
MKKISRRSKNIIKLIDSGMSQYAIIHKGYPRPTVRYYWYKIKRPEKFSKMIEKIKSNNDRRLDKMKNM